MTDVAPSQKRKRLSGKATGEEGLIPWTASRCLRLLRPLESRLEPLRKLRRIDNIKVDSGVHSRKRQKLDDQDQDDSSQRTTDQADSTDDDPAWMPNRQTRPAESTYLYRNTRNRASRVSDINTAVPLPTPFKAGSRFLGDDFPNESRVEQTYTHSADPSLPARKRKVVQQFEESAAASNGRIGELQNGIAQGLSHLLEITKAPSESCSSGCQSLFSMCLRRLPTYIELEKQDLLDADEDDDTDITTDIYTELQDLGSTHASGWNPLRQVVRAHGLDIVRELMDEGFLGDYASKMCVKTAFRESTYYELEPLVVSHVRSLNLTLPPKGSYSPFFYSLFFDNGWKGYGLLGDRIRSPWSWARISKELLVNGALSPLWLGHNEFQKSMQICLRTMTEPQPFHDIVAFYEAAIQSMCALDATTASSDREYGRNAYQTVHNLTVALTSIIKIDLRSDNSKSRINLCLALRGMIRSMATRLILHTIGQGPSPLSSDLDVKARYMCATVLMSALILEPTEDRVQCPLIRPRIGDLVSCIGKFLNHGTNDSDTGDCASPTDFVLAVALCCGQNHLSASFDTISALVGNLLDLAEDVSLGHKSFLHKVAVDSAASYAYIHKTHKARRFAWDTEAAVEGEDPLALDAVCDSNRPSRSITFHLTDIVANTPLSKKIVYKPESQDYVPSKRDTFMSSEPLAVDCVLEKDVDDSGYVSDADRSFETPANKSESPDQMMVDSNGSPESASQHSTQINDTASAPDALRMPPNDSDFLSHKSSDDDKDTTMLGHAKLEGMLVRKISVAGVSQNEQQSGIPKPRKRKIAKKIDDQDKDDELAFDEANVESRNVVVRRSKVSRASGRLDGRLGGMKGETEEDQTMDQDMSDDELGL